jgi:hypothetical protein
MLGILTIAVVTATVASRFRDQASGGDPDPDDPTNDAADGTDLDELVALRDQLDALIRARTASEGRS